MGAPGTPPPRLRLASLGQMTRQAHAQRIAHTQELRTHGSGPENLKWGILLFCVEGLNEFNSVTVQRQKNLTTRRKNIEKS